MHRCLDINALQRPFSSFSIPLSGVTRDSFVPFQVLAETRSVGLLGQTSLPALSWEEGAVCGLRGWQAGSRTRPTDPSVSRQQHGGREGGGLRGRRAGPSEEQDFIILTPPLLSPLSPPFPPHPVSRTHSVLLQLYCIMWPHHVTRPLPCAIKSLFIYTQREGRKLNWIRNEKVGGGLAGP